MIDLSSVKDIEIEERQKDSKYIYISISERSLWSEINGSKIREALSVNQTDL